MNIRVVHIVLNTFEYDSRVLKECKSLSQEGYDVTVIAYWRKGLKYEEESDGFKIYRLPLKTILWSNHPLIQCIKYFEFMVKSIILINRIKPHICHGHDPNGLFVAYFAKIIWRVYLIYDSHELWGYTSHMKSYNRILYKIGGILEKRIMKTANAIITVNESIAEIMKEKLTDHEIFIIRNIPENSEVNSKFSREYLQLPDAKFIIIYVGSIAKGRGIEKLIRIMEGLDERVGLAILGVEDIYMSHYKKILRNNNLNDRIKFSTLVKPDEVVNVCRFADIGIHPVENTCLNNYYCLPNKIFQYIHAGLPVLCSDFPEMRKIVKTYKVGKVFNIDNTEGIISLVNEMIDDVDKLSKYKHNSIIASEKLNWSIEKQTLTGIYSQFN